MNQRPKICPTEEEAKKLAEKMIEACVLFSNGKITFDQLWCRVRGNRRFTAVQMIKDKELGTMLLYLCLDFLSWKGEQDDLIMESAFRIAATVETERTTH